MGIIEQEDGFFEKIVEAKEKNLEYKGGLEFNYALPKELMITITLAEYRELVKADAEVSHERSMRYTMEARLKAAQNEINELKRSNMNLADQLVEKEAKADA